MQTVTKEQLQRFETYLREEERTASTVQQYLRAVGAFADWLGSASLCKAQTVAYKARLCERYKPASVNAALSALNRFFAFIDRHDLRVKNLKIQRPIFACAERELTKAEYERLLRAARKNERLYLLIQTICSTGIRVSELRYITVRAVERGVAEIHCKGKRRQVLLPQRLCRMLNQYIKEQKRQGGAVFVTRNGNPLDRSNIWSDMKRLCEEAGVSRAKVFPHNLRHLFARTYYRLEKDVVRLADILGHSNVNTTRIYTAESGELHRRQLQRLDLLRC